MDTNTRRNFIKTGLALGAAAALVDPLQLFAEEAATPPANPEAATPPATPEAATPPATPEAATPPATPKAKLAYIVGGTRAAMLDSALEKLGGIEAFVKKGQSVVIKPNIAWNRAPQFGTTTHPELVGHLVELCLKAGASVVNVFDHTCDNPWNDCYINSGIRAAVEAAGGKMVNGNDKNMYRLVAIPAGKRLKEDKVHQLILDSDVFINVPVLKHHKGTTITACMKNLMGVMWDRQYWHRNDLHQCIADFISLPKLRPTLNIIDAYTPMIQNGPRGAEGATTPQDLITVRALLASTDIVAIDAASARILGHAEDGIAHVKIASDSGFGTCKLKAEVQVERVLMTA